MWGRPSQGRTGSCPEADLVHSTRMKVRGERRHRGRPHTGHQMLHKTAVQRLVIHEFTTASIKMETKVDLDGSPLSRVH